MNRLTHLGLLFIILISSCKSKPVQVEENFVVEPSLHESSEVKEIIYSMYLPTDMSELFDKTGSNFNPGLPASVSTLPLYSDPEQIAVMLGVLGVDLSYLKILDQKVLAAEYFSSIKILAGKLQIPDRIFEESTRKLEQHIGDQDSLASLIEKVYKDTDIFFKENGDENLATLSLLGGWIEAMYIGVSIYEAEDGNTSMAHQILQQKFTLNSIYSILSNHQESLRITSYLLMLKRLRKEFDKVDIRYPVEGFSVDTNQKRIQTSNAQINYEASTLSEINRIFSQMREELIRVREE